MPEKVIPPEVLEKIRVGGLLSNVFNKCFEKKLKESYGDGIMMDFFIGESFILPGKGKVTIKVGEGKIIAPNQVLLDDVYQKLILCAEEMPAREADPTTIAEDQNPENIPGGGRKKRKTRKGKKRTRKMSRRRRQ
jgi:hypothetical protein